MPTASPAISRRKHPSVRRSYSTHRVASALPADLHRHRERWPPINGARARTHTVQRDEMGRLQACGSPAREPLQSVVSPTLADGYDSGDDSDSGPPGLVYSDTDDGDFNPPGLVADDGLEPVDGLMVVEQTSVLRAAADNPRTVRSIIVVSQ